MRAGLFDAVAGMAVVMVSNPFRAKEKVIPVVFATALWKTVWKRWKSPWKTGESGLLCFQTVANHTEDAYFYAGAEFGKLTSE